MNWLAHLYLSEPAPAFRIGNLLPDLLPMPVRAAVPEEFQAGMVMHARIDAFTDSHPVVRRSIRRLEGPFRRYAGVLMDVFYDHFLARDWDSFCAQPLPEFTAEVYESFITFRARVPQEAHAALDNMRANDWLCSYRTLDGLAKALERMGRRFRRPVDLAGAVPGFERHYAALEADFAEFFPELALHCGL